MAAEALIMMQQGQRSKVLEHMSQDEKDKMLERVRLWQRLCFLDDAYPPTMIVTEDGPLPNQFPDTMNECCICLSTYTLWASVNGLSCKRHSYCDTCRAGFYDCWMCRGVDTALDSEMCVQRASNMVR